MNALPRSGVFRWAEVRARIPGSAGEHVAVVAQRGTLNLLLSQPVDPNRQSPHSQDELYVVVRGRGVLFHDGRREPFQIGDAMFVAAGVEHWFEEFSDDLSVWVAFYGPPGGEA